LLIADEASGVPNAVFEAASGSMSGHSATTVLTGNPTRNTGFFYDTHNRLREDWYTMHVSCVTARA
jgi:phage terminase large subunit